MQNLAKNPQLQRTSFQNLAGKMMGQKGVTSSVKKEMQKAGVYYGSQKMSKAKYEKNLRKFSQHLEGRGIKETRFAKQIRQSLRAKKGLVCGGAAEKAFQRDLKKQYKEGEPTGGFDNLELGEKRKYLHKFLEKGIKGLTREDRQALGEEGIATLKERGERIKAINQSRMQRQREEENKQGKRDDEAGIPGEKTTTSGVHATNEEKGGSPQGQTGTPKSSGPVPLAGGINLGAATMGNQIEGGMERIMTSRLNSMDNREPQKTPDDFSNKSSEAEVSGEKDLRAALNRMVEGNISADSSQENKDNPGQSNDSPADSQADQDQNTGAEDMFGGADQEGDSSNDL